MTDYRYLSKEFITEFLEKYREFPCLWKIKSKDYTNKNLKNRAYDELLTVYSKRSGRSADDIHVPTLWYYHLLEFTVDQELPTDSVSNFNNIGVDHLDITYDDITDE
ncbi:MADF domain-containing protein, partial [Aphis craccivora]